MFASYIHDLDPVIFNISGNFALRWYGLAYLAGFVAGYFLLKYLSRKKLFPVTEEKVSDFITWTAIFGVLIGGRLGYVFFYQIPNQGFDSFLKDPFVVFKVWEGGMASHGGIIGVMLFTLFYSYKHKISWAALTDGLAIVAPVGLFCGRIANFINGELFGRIVPPGSNMGMKFPAEMFDHAELRNAAFIKIHEQCPDPIITSAGQVIPIPDYNYAYSTQWMIDRVRDTPQVREIVGSVLNDRYPSQLYEAAVEGCLLFAVLWFIRIRFPKAYNGTFCCIFSLLYAAGRIFVENYREPDSPFSMCMTRGQFLSLFLVLIGIGFLIYALKTKKTVQEK